MERVALMLIAGKQRESDENGKGVYQETSGPTIIDQFNAGQAERTDKPTHAEKSDFSRRAFSGSRKPWYFSDADIYFLAQCFM